MLNIRKIDLTAQLIIGGISILSLGTFTFVIFFIGTAVLGAWQIVSALINSFYMMQTTYKPRIILYWVLLVIALSLLFMGDLAMLMSIILSWGLAIFYCSFYRSFIEYVAFRKELSTIVRHH